MRFGPALLRTVLIAAFGLAVAPGAHAQIQVYSGFGTAAIDGVQSAGEWEYAGKFAFQANIAGGGTVPAVLSVMNDRSNLYVSIRLPLAGMTAGSLWFEFDANRSGWADGGDDEIALNFPSEFWDHYRTSAPPCPPSTVCAFTDLSDGGTNDGHGVFGVEPGDFATYELSHPLNSGDVHDMAFAAGEVLPFVFGFAWQGPGAWRTRISW